MKSIKSIIASFVLVGAALSSISCNKVLDLAPIDYYGSENFWKTEAQIDGYVGSINYYLRAVAWNHTIMFGELRGGLYQSGSATSDGNSRQNVDIILQKLDADHTGVESFGSYYSVLNQVNLFISRVEATNLLSQEKQDYYLGIGYGIRAFLYFDLYRIYGAVPLRLTPEVVDGEIDPQKLYMERHSPDAVMEQIKADIKSSLDYFGTNTAFSPYGYSKKVVWSKAATEYLAGEVYLWNAKVDVSDINGTHKAEPADIDAAETYFKNVTKNYGLSLQTNFAKIFDTSNKGNSETIFVIRFKEDEKENNIVNTYTYMTNGKGLLVNQVNADGTTWGDPMQLNGKSSGQMKYEYTTEFYNTFDNDDSRKSATFIPCYSASDYKKGNLVLFAVPVCKNVGHLNATTNVHIFDGDQPYFRLAGAYLALAEIANYKGVKADIETNINEVRKRAYGSKWNVDTYGYKASDDFETNELAILFEKDKEFVQEGQRWFDLCRMTSKKGGAVTDHFAFSSKATPTGAVLQTSEAYKLLWPIDKTVMSSDPKLKQTVGY